MLSATRILYIPTHGLLLKLLGDSKTNYSHTSDKFQSWVLNNSQDIQPKVEISIKQININLYWVVICADQFSVSN